MQILAFAGSLRENSLNRRVLLAAQHYLASEESMIFYHGLGDLPHYNADLDVEPLPEPVRHLRDQVRHTNAILICSPEYAGGVPGFVKNGLDWLVGSTAIVGKPTASINASPWSPNAQPSLVKTLSMIGARLVEDSCVTVPARGQRGGARELSQHPEIGPRLAQALRHLRAAVVESEAGGSGETAAP